MRPGATLFRKRRAGEGHGYAVGSRAGGWFTAGFMGAFALTFGSALRLAVDGHPLWPAPAIAALLILAGFLYVAAREAESAEPADAGRD